MPSPVLRDGEARQQRLEVLRHFLGRQAMARARPGRPRADRFHLLAPIEMRIDDLAVPTMTARTSSAIALTFMGSGPTTRNCTGEAHRGQN